MPLEETIRVVIRCKGGEQLSESDNQKWSITDQINRELTVYGHDQTPLDKFTFDQIMINTD